MLSRRAVCKQQVLKNVLIKPQFARAQLTATSKVGKVSVREALRLSAWVEATAAHQTMPERVQVKQ